MPTDKHDEYDDDWRDDERAEDVFRRWFAGHRGPAESDAALVVAEADAVRQEALHYAKLVQAEADALAATTFAGAPTPEAGLHDLLLASKVLVDMCEALLHDPKISAEQQKSVETVYEMIKPAPDMIRQAITDGQSVPPGSSSPAGTAGPGSSADGRPA